jgi:hypothetical protein
VALHCNRFNIGWCCLMYTSVRLAPRHTEPALALPKTLPKLAPTVAVLCRLMAASGKATDWKS